MGDRRRFGFGVVVYAREMSRIGFFDAFAQLLKRWIAYQEAPREPGSIAELAQHRKDLDDARAAAREARREHDRERATEPSGFIKKVSVDDDEIARQRVRTYTGEG